MRRLPPIPELIAFDAVARHLSFTLAAQELCITQSAVSHRIRRLEKHFRVRLIERLNPGLKLTEAGRTVMNELTPLLDQLSRIEHRIAGREERRLRVAAGNALCTWWLAGRLPNFMSRYPGVSIELIPTKNDHSLIDDVDLQIVWVGEEEGASSTQRPLFNEHVFPVCSPKLLAHRVQTKESSLLATLPLLHKLVHATGEWSWETWFDRLQLDRHTRGSELRFADVSLVLSAAVEGAGLALARSLLAHDALLDGRLIIPIANIEPMQSSKKYVVRWRGKSNADIDAFVVWLADEAQATLRSMENLFVQSNRSYALTA